MDNHLKEIKEKIKDSKDAETLNVYCENYISINNKIISIIEQLFNSYKILEDNKSILLNIINNSCFNTNYNKTPNSYLFNSYKDIYYQQCIKYFKNEYIISEASYPEQFKEKFYFSPSNTVNCLLEITNNIYASNIRKSPNILIYNFNDLNSKLKISFKAHQDNVSWIIKSSKNNLISGGDNGVIKIWCLIPETIFSDIDKNNVDPKNSNIINYELKPLYEYQPEIIEMKNIKKLLNITENTFLAISDTCIFLFEYTIKEINSNIKLLQKKDIELIDIILIETKNNENIIGAYSKTKLFLLNITNLEIIKEMDINTCPEKNCLIQLNENEIMISQKEPEPNLIIIDINKWNIRLTYKNNKFTDYLYKLKDGTIIQSGPKGIWRFTLKNFEELPVLYKPFNDTEFDYPYECYEKISCLKELDNGKIMKCVIIGKMSICNLVFL